MKTKKLPLKVDIKDFPGQKTIKLFVNDRISKDLILLLALLRESLTDSVELVLDNFNIHVKTSKNNVSTCLSADFEKKNVKLSLSMNSLEYLMFYLLRYYRDDIGESKHIDVDFGFSNATIVTVIVELDVASESSEEEMRDFLEL